MQTSANLHTKDASTHGKIGAVSVTTKSKELTIVSHNFINSSEETNSGRLATPEVQSKKYKF